VPEVVWQSKFFWVALILMVVFSLMYPRFLIGLKSSKIWNSTFGQLKIVSLSRALLTYHHQGSQGTVLYESPEALFELYFEFGGDNCLASISIPDTNEWEKKTGLPVERREEVIQFIGRQVIKDQTSNGLGTYKLQNGFLNIYA
jgi:hypothetical protein